MDEMESLRGLEEAMRQKVASEAGRLEAARLEEERLGAEQQWKLSQVREMEGPDLALRVAAAAPTYKALVASPEWERLNAVTLALFRSVPRLEGLRFEEQNGVAVEVSRRGTGLGRSVDDCRYALCMTDSGLVLRRRLWTKYHGVREQSVAWFDSVEELGSVAYRRNLAPRERFAVGLSVQTFLTLLESGELFGRLVEDARRELANRRR